jgi:peptide chain release factor 1
MLDKLNIVQQRINEISDLIIQPNIISDQKRYIKLNKEYKDYSVIIEKKKLYVELLAYIKEAE